MSFDQAFAALRAARPDAEVGLTAQRGKYHDQARRMVFQKQDDWTYFAVGARGKVMWLFVDERGRIFCGNKG